MLVNAIKALSGGSATMTVEIDQDNCYSADVTKTCTNALVIIGNKADSASNYDQEYVGYVLDGTLYPVFNYSNRYTVSYNGGVLTMRGGYNTNYGWIKIMYD